MKIIPIKKDKHITVETPFYRIIEKRNKQYLLVLEREDIIYPFQFGCLKLFVYKHELVDYCPYDCYYVPVELTTGKMLIPSKTLFDTINYSIEYIDYHFSHTNDIKKLLEGALNEKDYIIKINIESVKNLPKIKKIPLRKDKIKKLEQKVKEFNDKFKLNWSLSFDIDLYKTTIDLFKLFETVLDYKVYKGGAI